MPKLARAAVEASLTKKGFEVDERDHRFFRLVVDGRYTGIQTKTSRGSKYKTLGNDLVAHMAKQLHLTTRQSGELVECTLSADAYRHYCASAASCKRRPLLRRKRVRGDISARVLSLPRRGAAWPPT